MITVSKTVKDKKKTLVGVMAIDFFLDSISKEVENYKSIDKSNLFILDNKSGKYFVVPSNDKSINNMENKKTTLINSINKISAVSENNVSSSEEINSSIEEFSCYYSKYFRFYRNILKDG
ncbi:Cache domain protein [Clostridium luticellarii]|jgi:hypothetical protein|uniref:Cache domain protein n=1 Tax=Clostridium luticellarii TaxID=1691940 RepID=A0A2T0BQG3_9CLOT|nr:Cache domain protein [Clostridium luticellarii]